MYFWELRLLGDIKSDVSWAPEMREKSSLQLALLLTIYMVFDKREKSLTPHSNARA